MKAIIKEDVQTSLERYTDRPVYIHLETTTGSYSAHLNEKNMTVVAYIRNAKVTYHQAKIKGNGVPRRFENGRRLDLRRRSDRIYSR